MEIESARRNMLTQQIRASDVLDERLLSVIAATPREQFVPARYRTVAFADERLPLAHDQYMMTPTEESRMLHALDCRERDAVLEIGTGSGYVTALLSQLSGRVVSIDCFDDFTQSARQPLDALGLRNVTLQTGDGLGGYPQHAPYDVICVTGSVTECPAAYREQLSVGGRLFIVVGSGRVMRAMKIVRTAADVWEEYPLFETALLPLVGSVGKAMFTF